MSYCIFRQRVINIAVVLFILSGSYLAHASQSGVLICSDILGSPYEDQYLVIHADYFSASLNQKASIDELLTEFVLENNSTLGQAFLSQTGRVPTYCREKSFTVMAADFPELKSYVLKSRPGQNTPELQGYKIISLPASVSNDGIPVRAKSAFLAAVVAYALSTWFAPGYSQMATIIGGLACYLKPDECHQLFVIASNKFSSIFFTSNQPHGQTSPRAKPRNYNNYGGATSTLLIGGQSGHEEKGNYQGKPFTPFSGSGQRLDE